MKKRILTVLIAISLVMTGSIYASEPDEGDSREQESAEDDEEERGEKQQSDSSEDDDQSDGQESGDSGSSESDGGDTDEADYPDESDGSDAGDSQEASYSDEDSDYYTGDDSADTGYDIGGVSDHGNADDNDAAGDYGYSEPDDGSVFETEQTETAEEAVFDTEEEAEAADWDISYTEEEDFSLLDHFGLVSSGVGTPTQQNGGWASYPASYEYNWDNTDNATKWGMWGGNGNLQGYVAESIEDVNVRHRMQMYCDGENIHLIITYASCFDNSGNGNDYNFYIDGEQAKFRVVYDDDGADLTEKRAPGTYTLKVLQGDGSDSSDEAWGSTGTMTVCEGQLNNVTEISIPLSEMQRQNANINADSFAMVEFFTPNLMYRRIATGGASSGPVPFTAMTFAFFGGAYYCMTQKKRRSI